MASWRSVPEAGSILGIKLVVGCYRLFGRWAAAAMLWFITAYFVLFARTPRRASIDYQRRIGLPGTWRKVHEHLWCFARAVLDRLLFLVGDFRGLTIEHHGHDELMAVVAQKRGALLVGAHLGSFEAMRTLAAKYEVPLLVLVDFQNAQRVTGMLQALAGEKRVHFRLLELAPGDPLALLKVKEAIENGELVAMLGDRRTDRPDRDVSVPFMGGAAKFPVGPWVLAHVLQCPVYFVAGLFSPPSRYDLHCELLAERVELSRRSRAEDLARYAGTYAARLEAYTRRAPLNWFNFFPFWENS